jgi:hypothetical protein
MCPTGRSEMSSGTFKMAAFAASLPALAPLSPLTTAEATRTVTISSHITIKSNGLTFSGRVSSGKAPCRSAREVTLYRKQSQVLGSTATNSAGGWKITVSGSAGITLGHFYATVKRRTDGTAGTIYLCKAARSQTIAYKA